jgi:hypothetical protein
MAQVWQIAISLADTAGNHTVETGHVLAAILITIRK